MSGTTPLTIQSGLTVRFPVAATHPLAQYQTLKALSDVANLNDLAVSSALTNINPKLTSAQLNAAVGGFLSAQGASAVAQLQFPDLHVEEGATLVFAGPITVVVANNFYVDGTIIAYGSLNISCASFGASPAPLVNGGGGGGGQTKLRTHYP
jgi:hypothetical protein